MIQLTFQEPVVLNLQPARELNSSELSRRLSHMAAHEKELSLAFLLDLLEVNRRKIYVDLNCPSIFLYLTEYLKLEKGPAWTRLKAMQAIEEMPELADAIRDGTLSISVIARVQAFLEKADRLKDSKGKQAPSPSTTAAPSATPANGVDNALNADLTLDLFRDFEKAPPQSSSKLAASETQKPVSEGMTPRHDLSPDEPNEPRSEGTQFEEARCERVGCEEAKNQNSNGGPAQPISSEPLGKIDTQAKKDLFERMANKSLRDAQQLLAGLSPTMDGREPEKPKIFEKVRDLPQGFQQITLVASPELVAQLTRLKEVVSHSHPNATFIEVVELAFSHTLSHLDPVEKAKRSEARQARREAALEKQAEKMHGKVVEPEEAIEPIKVMGAVQTVIDVETVEAVEPTVSVDQAELSFLKNQISENQILPAQHPGWPESSEPIKANPKWGWVPVDTPSRTIPAEIRHQVWVRDNGACQRQDSGTGKICGSRVRTQLHHVKPYAMGGNHSVDNIEIRCQACNARAAIADFGAGVMREFL